MADRSFKKKRSSENSERSEKPTKIHREGPTHFFAFRITNPEIRDKVKSIQNLAVDKNPLLQSCLINLDKLHITLGVFHLKDDVDVNNVTKIMNDWYKARSDVVFKTPIRLDFENVDHFTGRVLFANITRCENYSRLCELANELQGLMDNAGYQGDSRKYNPHLTILKLSKGRALFRYKKDINKLFNDLKVENVKFGPQNIEHLQLLSMRDKARDGYYHCCHEIDIPLAKTGLLAKESAKLAGWRTVIKRKIHTACSAIFAKKNRTVLGSTTVICLLFVVAGRFLRAK